ncbi:MULTISPECIES: type II toxin-antitoxin system RelE/ParE family toxin [unclassified Caulobacter]|uniref:type II toxin-antitoxin system RelE/ParE family toxin n=1 Tax=unclassified Caulobacter TaxID=2648921 RepID=UPI0009EA4272|nr:MULTISPECIES: type II toxin-antitoxin system RelE/ParE family toxin [unclassified Caulobacter]
MVATDEFSVELSRPAAADFQRLVVWLRARDPKAAAHLGERLEDATDSLGTHPHRGRLIDETVRELTLPFGRDGYILRYEVLGRRVIVTRLWHSLEHR